MLALRGREHLPPLLWSRGIRMILPQHPRGAEQTRGLAQNCTQPAFACVWLDADLEGEGEGRRAVRYLTGLLEQPGTQHSEERVLWCRPVTAQHPTAPPSTAQHAPGLRSSKPCRGGAVPPPRYVIPAAVKPAGFGPARCVPVLQVRPTQPTNPTRLTLKLW